jgi:hypothetical protein
VFDEIESKIVEKICKLIYESQITSHACNNVTIVIIQYLCWVVYMTLTMPDNLDAQF